MPGHMVNACYDPFRNDITFPAAILQKPFYSIDQKPEENLGGIGAVIGHEISHAFDSNGAHFDENGNLFDWWAEEDMKTFEGLTKKMTEQFEGIPFHGGKVSGELVCAENIADNGGMAVTIEIMHKRQNPDFGEPGWPEKHQIQSIRPLQGTGRQALLWRDCRYLCIKSVQ